MKRLVTLLFILFNSMIHLSGQTDSLSIGLEISLRGRRQTGNLNQLAINPNVKFILSKKKFSTEIQADYQYLNVNEFIAINDFWTTGIYRHNSSHMLFPFIATRYGFAKSYKIRHSLLTGIGIGLNIRKKSLMHLMQIHVFGGYMNFKFENKPSHTAPAIGSIIKFINPIGKRINISWELHTYHSGNDIQFWGASNTIMLFYRVHKNISLNISHATIFNNKTISNIKKANTLMLFGINYSQLN